MLSVGTRLGPYEVTAQIGEGGMGQVYRARDTKLDRDVAIKILPEAFAHDADRLARFQREAKTLASLNHPNIAHIHGLEESGGITALVMELVDGEDLSQKIEGHRAKGSGLPLDEALPIAKQIADALEIAHAQGIIHRDLKPANIKVRADGTVKVLDFGLAKAIEGAGGAGRSGGTGGEDLANSPTLTTPAMTMRGVILGTAAYMAPEQAKGKLVDRRADLWAFGVVVYEMLTGRRAFKGEDTADTIAAVINKEPDWTALPAGTPAPIRTVRRRCLEKDRKRRLDSAAAARLEIEEALMSPAVQTTQASAPARAASSRAPWFALAVAAVAIIALAIPAVRHMRETPALAAVRFGVFPPESTTFSSSGAAVPTTQFAVSPDGTHLAFVATEAGGRPMVWIRPLDSMQAKILPGAEDAAYPFWSADCRFVGFFAQGKLKKADLAGGPPQALADAPSLDTRGATWNRDGIIVFPSNSTSGLMQVNANGGALAPAIPLRDGDISYRWPSFLPDGRHFLFYVRAPAERRGVYVGSVGSTTMTRMLDTPFHAIYSAGYLLTARDRTLLAYPFDEKRLQVVGEPVQVAENVGGTSTQLAAFSLSAGGVLVHARGLTTSSRLTWFDREGKATGHLTESGDYVNFRFSPDERRVAFSLVDPSTITLDIWLMDVARGVPTRFTFDPLNDTAPVWSPDGTRIVFRSDRAGGNLMFEKAATGGETERLLTPFAAQFPSDWSDGKYILYYSPFPVTQYDVMLLPQFGDRKPIPFEQSTFMEVAGRFSPDGRHIAYASDESGRFEIYVQPFPPSGSKWRVSNNGGFEPRWSRDGKELFYLALDGTLTAVPLNASATFDSGHPQPLFQTRVPFLGSVYRSQYEVVGDGRRFLVNTLDDGAGFSPITVVLNWTAGLKK